MQKSNFEGQDKQNISTSKAILWAVLKRDVMDVCIKSLPRCQFSEIYFQNRLLFDYLSFQDE